MFRYKKEDLHGYVPDESPIVLILVDVINDLEFEGAEEIVENFREIAGPIASLKKRAKKAGIPVIYANDNFGRWRSDLKSLLDHCLNDAVRGKSIVKLLKPDKDDYFILKPKHSAFFSTALDVLLIYLKAKTLILAGITGDICILFTAHDAYMRDYQIIVPMDCVASASKEDNTYALEQVRKILKADIRPSAEIDLASLPRN